MPNKVKGRSTVLRWLEVCLPMAAGQKIDRKACLSPSRGVEDGTPKSNPDVLMGG